MFIPFGMTSKIVMVVQYENLLVSTVLLLIEVRSRQPTEPAADNDEVVGFRQFGRWTPVRMSAPRSGMGVIV